MSEQRLAGLPKWAREKIRNLQRDLSNEQEHNRKMVAGESNTYCLRLGSQAAYEEIPLMNDHVRFYMGDKRTYIDLRRDGGQLVVMGSYGLTIAPAASNVIHLQPELPDWKGEQ